MTITDFFPGETDNETRAAYAHAALSRYAELAHHAEPGIVDDSEGVAIVAAEMIGDLLHLLFSERVKVGSVLSDAFSTFAEECEEEGASICDPIAMVKHISTLAGRPGAYFDRLVAILDYFESEGWHGAGNPFAA
jgi:hypothetical protein